MQSIPSFFAIALISTSTASAPLVHRAHPTCDLIEVQDQQSKKQKQFTTKNRFYELMPVMQPDIIYHGVNLKKLGLLLLFVEKRPPDGKERG